MDFIIYTYGTNSSFSNKVTLYLVYNFLHTFFMNLSTFQSISLMSKELNIKFHLEISNKNGKDYFLCQGGGATSGNFIEQLTFKSILIISFLKVNLDI